MSSQMEAKAVLVRWRQVERELTRAEPGSPEAERLQTAAALLRDEYQRLIQEVGSAADGPLQMANTQTGSL